MESPYAPDRWIKWLNSFEPNIWTRLRKFNAAPREELGLECSDFDNIPEWCYMPTLYPFLMLTYDHGFQYYIENMNQLMSIASMYTWRATKGVYHFEKELYDALIDQPLDGDLPCECLFHLPEWAVYIETPGLLFEHANLDGFIAHLDYNMMSRSTDLQFAIFAENCIQPRMVALPLENGGTIADALERTDQVDRAFIPGGKPHYIGTRGEYTQTFTSMIQLLLYLCSDEPDMPKIEHPMYRRCLTGGVRSPREPQTWTVGTRIASAIRKYNNQNHDYRTEGTLLQKSSHAGPKPHVRSAHWHTYWVGPRNETYPIRKPILHWLPPIPVGINENTVLPTSVHNVIS